MIEHANSKQLARHVRFQFLTAAYIKESSGMFAVSFVIHFPVGSRLKHRAPFGVSVITHTIRHTVRLLWTSDQPVAETSTYTGQHNI
jgi:hypothetical protein